MFPPTPKSFMSGSNISTGLAFKQRQDATAEIRQITLHLQLLLTFSGLRHFLSNDTTVHYALASRALLLLFSASSVACSWSGRAPLQSSTFCCVTAFSPHMATSYDTHLHTL